MPHTVAHSPRALDKSGYLAEDTIAAIATAIGGAIGIVRVSGPDAFGSLARIASASEVAGLSPRALMRANLTSPIDNTPIDDALVVKFASPASFTGEDSVEYHVHGGTFVAAKLMAVLEQLGIRQALPGEFSFRAVRNGKMSLSQAEATADLIAAANEGALTLALEKMSGTQARLIQDLAEGLRTLSTLGEVGIDFSDQDVEEVSLPVLKRRLEPLLAVLRDLYSSYDRGSRLQDGIGVALLGLPNAGKSSFFNALLGEDRSIVSEIAGTTRDIVRERLTLRSHSATVTFRLEDTAGLRKSLDQVERMGVERSHKAARDADLILLMIDSTADLGAALEEWSRLGSPIQKTVGVITKCDLASAERLVTLRRELKNINISLWLETSAVTGRGIADAATKMVEFCERWVHRQPGEVLLTRQNHLRAVQVCIQHLERAAGTQELDLFAADVRQALHSLSPLIGTTVADDILGRIFSEFCIGK